MGKKSGHEARLAERRVQAFELRKAGASYRAIGRALGVSVFTAHRDVHQMLDDLATKERESAIHLREMELERLDEMLRSLWPAIRRGEPPAIATALRVSERRARLCGLDAPARQELTGADGAPLTFVEVARQFADASKRPR